MATLKEGAKFFIGISQSFDVHKKGALNKAGRTIRDEAKRVLGTYDYGWVPLKDATIEHKKRGDTPLLETGELRDSIQYSVDALEGVVTIGSNNVKAIWHELGTSRGIPPRPFLSGACKVKEKEVLKILGEDFFDRWIRTKTPFDEE